MAVFEIKVNDSCAFCGKAPPETPALLGRNDAAVCPGCLRSCVDVAGNKEA